MSPQSIVIGALCLASLALARTDLQGCTYFDTVSAYPGGEQFATRIWYVPDSGELCEFLDCGGGQAPPITTVPGCAAYKGTKTYSPSFIKLNTLGHAPATHDSAITTAGSVSITTVAPSSGITSTTAAPVTTTAPKLAGAGSDTAKVTGTPLGSGSSGAVASDSMKSMTTTRSTAVAANVPTDAAALCPWMVAGVAAALGLF